jgi:hypothetical protein
MHRVLKEVLVHPTLTPAPETRIVILIRIANSYSSPALYKTLRRLTLTGLN